MFSANSKGEVYFALFSIYQAFNLKTLTLRNPSKRKWFSILAC